MMIPVDYQPPFVPNVSEDANPQSRQTEEVISVDTEDATPQSRQTEEIIPVDSKDATPESQHTGEARKMDRQRLRQERIQNRSLQKEQNKREYGEFVENTDRIIEKLHQKWLEAKALRQEDNAYFSMDRKPAVSTSKVIKQPPEWELYGGEDGWTSSALKRTSWRVEKFTLELARCMVGLESFTGDRRLFSCSGTIIEFLMGIGYVVTSASLVRSCPVKDEQADELKINVWLPSGEKLEGSVSHVDFYYNLCVLKVPSTFQLPSKSFSSDTRFFNFYECHSKDVVALGHICKPWCLKVALGKLMPRRSQLDCEELLVFSCGFIKRSVGGPLMDFDGNIIGMNFYGKNETPFLPSFIVSKCLQHFKDFGKVIRPLHGLRVRTLHEAPLTVLEKIQHGFPEVRGVIVEKVEVSLDEHSEIKVGDIITHINGVPFSNAAELGGVLLDTCGKHMLEIQKLDQPEDCNKMPTVINLKFDVKTLRGRKSETTTRTIKVDKFTPTSGLNIWPFGKRYTVRRIINGAITTEVRYTS